MTNNINSAYSSYKAFLQPINFNSTPTDFKACTIIDANGEHQVRIHRILPDGCMLLPINISLDNKRKAISALVRQGVDGFTASKLVKEACSAPLNVLHNPANLGWQFDANNNITGYACGKVLDRHGNEIVKDPYFGLPETAGNLQEQIAWYQKHLSEKVLRQIVFLHTLSGILYGLLKETSILSLVASSSKGKTTTAKIAQTIYCSPDYTNLCKSFSTTEIALVKSFNNFNGVAALVDDTQLARFKSFQQIIYELSQGISRQRMVKGQQLAPTYQWACAISFTAENSILATCKKDDEGVLPRCLEIHFTPTDLFNTAGEAEAVEKWMASNYGNIAPAFASYLMKHDLTDKISLRRAEEIQRIRETVTEVDPILMRCIKPIATIILTAKLAKEAFGMDFDVQEIQDNLLSICWENISLFRSEQTRTMIVEQSYETLVALANTNLKDNQKEDFVYFPSTELYKAVMSIVGEDTKKSAISHAYIESGLVYMTRGAFAGNNTFCGKLIPSSVRLKIKSLEQEEERQCA